MARQVSSLGGCSVGTNPFQRIFDEWFLNGARENRGRNDVWCRSKVGLGKAKRGASTFTSDGSAIDPRKCAVSMC
jgi:hypothetical protein